MPVSTRAGVASVGGRKRRGRPDLDDVPVASIVFSTSNTRDAPSPLHDSTFGVTGNIYVFTSFTAGIASVQIYLGANQATVLAQAAAGVGDDTQSTWVRNDATPHFDLNLATVGGEGTYTVAYRVTPTVGSPYVASATFTLDDGEDPPDNEDRYPGHGVNTLLSRTTTFGAPITWTDGNRGVPKMWNSGNIDRQNRQDAVKLAWGFAKGAREGNFARACLTVPLAWMAQGYRKSPSASLAALTAVGTNTAPLPTFSAFRPTVDADGVPVTNAAGDTTWVLETMDYATFYGWIARVLYFQGHDDAIIRLGHEHNRVWCPWHSGHGRGALYVAAWNKAAAAFRAISPNFTFDFNLAHPGAEPDGETTDETEFYNPDSWPTGTYEPDSVGYDVYCRSGGRDPVDMALNLGHWLDLCEEKNKPGTMPETGVTLPIQLADHPRSPKTWIENGVEVTATYPKSGTAGSDAQGETFIYLASAFASHADLAYFLWWNAAKLTQGYKYWVDRDNGRQQSGFEGGTMIHEASPLSWRALKGVYDGKFVILAKSGTLSQATNVASVVNDSGGNRTIRKVVGIVDTYATGQPIILDVNIDGTTVFTSQTRRPTLAAESRGGISEDAQAATWTNGSTLSIDIDQVGSTVAGADLKVYVHYT